MSALAMTAAGDSPAGKAEHEGYSDALIATATRYRESAALFAALELDLFERLRHAEGRARPLAELVAETGFSELPLRLLLDTLVAMRLLERDAAGYALAEATGELLRVDQMGAWLLSNKRQNEIWLHLADMVRGRYRGPVFYEDLSATPLMASYLRSIAQTNAEAAGATVDAVAARRPALRRGLDVGAGHGLFSQRLLERFPDARATLFDLPQSLAVGRRQMAQAGLAGRCSFIAGDAKHLQIDGPFDLIMVNDLLHYFTLAEKRRLIARAAARLAPGGLLAVCKIALDEDDPEPAIDPAMISLRFFINTQGGYLEGDRELADLFEAAGLEGVERLRLSPFKTLLLGRAAPPR